MKMATKGISPAPAPSTASGTIYTDISNLLQEGNFIANASKLSYEVELALAHSLQKLANLENLLLHVVSEENYIQSIDASNDDYEFFERAFAVDLLYSISLLEVRELDRTMCDLRCLISNAIRRISASLDNSTEMNDELLSKLIDSEEMLKDSQESVFEMKVQLANLQTNSVILRQDEWLAETVMEVKKEKFQSESEESTVSMGVSKDAFESAEFTRLREKAEVLEETLETSESRLNEALRNRIEEMNLEIESLREGNIALSERNEVLEEEVGFLRTKVEITEKALNQVVLDRQASEEGIRSKTSVVIDTVMQIGFERERIMKKVNYLIEENKSLRKKLRKDSSEIVGDNTKKDKKKHESVAIKAIKDDNRVERSFLGNFVFIFAMAVVVFASLSILASKYSIRIEFRLTC